MIEDNIPAHEHLGRLPRAIRERIWGELRCGRTRWDGKPCRHLIAEPGQTCKAHCEGNCQKCRACYLEQQRRENEEAELERKMLHHS